MKIIKATAIIDFYVSKKKYKKESSKRRYVEGVMYEHLDKLVGRELNGMEVRYVRVSPNNFWGSELNFINDIGYSHSNKVEKVQGDKIALRVFSVDIIGIDLDDNVGIFEDILGDGFLLSFSSVITI